MFSELIIADLNINVDFPVIQAVIDGKQEGKVFSFKNSVFILHKAGFGYFIDRDNCCDTFLNFILNSEFSYLHIYDASNFLIKLLEDKSANIDFWVRQRRRLLYKKASLVRLSSLEFRAIDIDFNNYNLIKSFGLNLDKRFWSGENDFLDNSLATIVTNHSGTPVSICYAAAIANFVAEIDIFTQEQYRNKGLAKICAAHFVNKCIHNDIVPSWDCFISNIGSYKTSISIGFEEVYKYNFLTLSKTK